MESVAESEPGVQPVPGKLVCYLDQMVVSQLAKALGGLLRDKAQESAANRLYERLLDLVNRDRIIFPSSEFHYLEGLQDDRLLEHLRSVTAKLGMYTAFRIDVNIMLHQAAEAACAFLLGIHPEYAQVQIAFGINPRLPAEYLDNRPIDRQILRWSLSWDRFDKQAEAYRLAKGRSGVLLLENRLIYQAVSLNQEDLIAQERRDFVRKYFIDPLSWGAFASIRNLRTIEEIDAVLHRNDMIRRAWHLYETFCILLNNVIPEDAVVDSQRLFHAFLRSDLIASIPYFDIYSTLYVTAMVNRAYRTEPSDIFDFNIAACVMPYVDIFVTDIRLCELIRQSKLSKRYQVQVQAAGKWNIQALADIIQEVEAA